MHLLLYIQCIGVPVRCMCDLGINVMISLLAMLPSGTTRRSTDFARQDKTNTAQIKHRTYVTRSGKRYNSAQKFKMELFIALHCALLTVYDDASRSILAFSVLEL